MKLRQLIRCLLMLVIVIVAAESTAQRGRPEPATTSETPGHRLLPGETSRTSGPGRAPANGTHQVLGSWSFDGPGGIPDAQGWTTADATAQLDTFFHVDDFAGFGGGDFGGLVALQGAKSMWCGTGATDTLPCGYATAPGYGFLWNQRLESTDFVVDSTVTLSFLVYYDSEPGYDYTYVEYLSATGSWNELDSFNGRGTSFVSSVIPPDSINGVVRFRFRFVSDNGGCDEDGVYNSDGAVIIDSLVVRDGPDIIDYQDFETEAVGAFVTADGDWSASVEEPYGDFAALFDGATLVQEDSLVTNTTNMWGFFYGSTETYDCGGYPLQPAVPKSRIVERDMIGIRNELRSPMVELAVDTSGAPVPAADAIVLEFDVYRDLPLENVVFYDFLVRSVVDGCTGAWRGDGYVYRGLGVKEWYRFSKDITQYIDPGATHVEVAIQAVDMCYWWCGIYGDGDCHSHAPLVDNVEIRTVGADLFTVTNVDTGGPGSLEQAIRDANQYSTPSTITFDIPGPGPHEIYLSKPLSTLTGPTTIDATTQPGYAGTPLVKLVRNWNSPPYSGPGIQIGPSGNSAVIGLAFDGFGNTVFESAVYLDSDSNTVRANVITNCYSGVVIEGSGNIVGGLLDGERNEIIGTSADGVVVWNGAGNTIRGNIISDCGEQGIDLGNDGPTVNDPLDADTGANDLQNTPVLTGVNQSLQRIQGTLDSEPGTIFEIDFYANPTGCSPAGHEAGARHIGSATVTTDGAGHAAFSRTVTEPFLVFEAITATATNPSGSTSEFSACFLDGNWILVTNTNDSGAGSLRQAILDANADAGLDYIGFNIPGPGPHTIAPATLLPDIVYPVHIVGYSQPGSSVNTSGTWEGGNAVVKIFLDGSGLAGTSDFGLRTRIDGCTIQGLAVGNFSGYGIDLNSNNNIVKGCYIGTDASGVTAAPNNVGISAAVISDNNTIGGSEPADRNVISGNTLEGVQILTAANNTVWGNFIGVDATGVSGLGNGTNGVRLGKAANDRIWFNVISANGAEGLAVRGPTLTGGTSIRGNRIGTDVTGSAALGNGADGIQIVILFGGAGIVIGGAPGYKNLIAHNAGAGVSVELPEIGLATVSYNEIHSNAKGVVVVDPTAGSTHTMSNIIGNSIHSNIGLGIDLADDGETANDPGGDPDTGPNNLQNFPTLMLATASNDSIRIQGTLMTTPDTEFRVEFFSNAVCGPNMVGEGATYLGYRSMTTNSNGDVVIDETLPGLVPGGYYITSTARPLAGNGTSEFSRCAEFFNSTTGSSVVVIPVDVETGESPVKLTFDNITGMGNTSLTVDDTGPEVPGSYILGDTTQYWNLTTTATYTDSIEVCFTYDESLIAGAESDIVLLHWDETLVPADWVDITTSLDTVQNIVCGRTATLSPFVAAVTDPASGTTTNAAPSSFALRQNVPNPFNPSTSISYDVPTSGEHVTIRVYDVAGRHVRTLVDGYRPQGTHRVSWDGRNAHGQRLSTGVYFCRMQAGVFVETRKMVLLK